MVPRKDIEALDNMIGSAQRLIEDLVRCKTDEFHEPSRIMGIKLGMDVGMFVGTRRERNRLLKVWTDRILAAIG